MTKKKAAADQPDNRPAEDLAVADQVPADATPREVTLVEIYDALATAHSELGLAREDISHLKASFYELNGIIAGLSAKLDAPTPNVLAHLPEILAQVQSTVAVVGPIAERVEDLVKLADRVDPDAFLNQIRTLTNEVGEITKNLAPLARVLGAMRG